MQKISKRVKLIAEGANGPTTPEADHVVRMTAAFIAVSDMAKKRKLYMRDAAYMIAIARVAQACRDRGWL